ncbi:MAG: hypothetical protein FD174_2650 [Geobacteraceae bacterium]|nr:MAG: hypothetical protein FD174_2650 [Geobacteraceae bacterium]
MRTLWRIPCLAAWLWIAMSGVGHAKSVYLQDGGIVECESFRRQGESVVVKVNRDVVLEFGSGEVDLQKTFRPHKKTVRKRYAHKIPADTAGASQPSQVAPVTSSGIAQRPTPDQGPIAPAANPQASAAVSTPIPAPDPALANKAPMMPDAPPQVSAIAAMGSSSVFLLAGSGLAAILLMVAAQWKIFEKAGQAGWKSLIPIYNVYLLIVIAGKPWWWLILMLIPLVGIVICLLMTIALANKFGKGTIFGLGLFFAGIVFFPVLAFDGSTYND